MLVVHPSLPVNSVAEFVAYAKAKPVSYAHGGHGSPGHLIMELFRMMAGFPATPVPYRGNTQLAADLAAGQIKVGFVGMGGILDHVRAGRLRGSQHRLPIARPWRQTFRLSPKPDTTFIAKITSAYGTSRCSRIGRHADRTRDA